MSQAPPPPPPELRRSRTDPHPDLEREAAFQISKSGTNLHPHEPGIPPALDPEGCCRVCQLTVRLADAEQRNEELREALRTLVVAAEERAQLPHDAPLSNYRRTRQVANRVIDNFVVATEKARAALDRSKP